jgi:CRISPR-associated protein Csm2
MTISSIMNADTSGEEMVTFARQTALSLVKNGLTRAKIRTIFTEVRKIESLWDNRPADALRRLNMLKPKLDYQTARSESVKLLKDTLSQAIDEVNKAPAGEKRDQAFRRFMDLFEAILAYHRSEGGQK